MFKTTALLPIQEHQRQLAALRNDCLVADRQAAEARRAAGAAAAEAAQHAARAAQLQACCERQQSNLKVRAQRVLWCPAAPITGHRLQIMPTCTSSPSAPAALSLTNGNRERNGEMSFHLSQALERARAELAARLQSGGPAELERLRAEAAVLRKQLSTSSAEKVQDRSSR